MNTNIILTHTIYTKKQLCQLPKIPQIAIAGRSNVGKSSLINSLFNRKKLAKVSSKPGKTQSINFYLVENFNFYLVDLPGYGYARRSKKEKQLWAQLITDYLTTTPYLKGVLILLDAKLPPQKLDLDLISFLEYKNIPFLPALTKVDKCKQKELSENLKKWSLILNKPINNFILFSSKTGLGKQSLFSSIQQLIINPDKV